MFLIVERPGFCPRAGVVQGRIWGMRCTEEAAKRLCHKAIAKQRVPGIVPATSTVVVKMTVGKMPEVVYGLKINWEGFDVLKPEELQRTKLYKSDQRRTATGWRFPTPYYV